MSGCNHGLQQWYYDINVRPTITTAATLTTTNTNNDGRGGAGWDGMGRMDELRRMGWDSVG